MSRATLLLTAMLLASSTPALAFHCPQDMAAIDAAMPSAQLSDVDREKVVALRKEGEQLHDAGKHADSIKVLGQAKKILGIK